MGRIGIVDYYARQARRPYLLTSPTMIRVYCVEGHEIAAEPRATWAGSYAEAVAGREVDCPRCKEGGR